MNAILEAPHAARMSGQDAARDAQEFVTFRLGTEEYGIDILRVQEIRSYEEPTRIANAPAFIKGVINLRGVIVPIIDLRLKFALDSAEYNTSTVVIVLNVAARTVGVVVDAVSDVLELAAPARRPAPARLCTHRPRDGTTIVTAPSDSRRRRSPRSGDRRRPSARRARGRRHNRRR